MQINKETIKHLYSNIRNNTCTKIIYLKNKYLYLLKPLFILIVIFFLAFITIFRANFNYSDDLGRVHQGYTEWEHLSRYISTGMAYIIHTSTILTDISPLTQFIAIVFLAISGVVLLHLFKKDKITFTSILAVSIIGISPYFLECISYKFDSPYMALSILASILPFIFYNDSKKEKIIFSIAIFLGTLVMCMTYQASSGIIPILTMFLAYKYWNNKDLKKAISIIWIAAISYIVGLLFFKMFLLNTEFAYMEPKILPLNDLIPGFIRHLIEYYRLVISDLKFLWVVLIIFIVVSFVRTQIKNTCQKKFISFIVVSALLIFSAILAFGVYPALEEPLYDTRAMYGFSVLLSIIALNVTNDKKQYISKLLVISLCWCFFVFSFTYGNALNEQKRYIDFRVTSVINSLNELEIMNTEEIKTITIKGSAGDSPVISNMTESYKKLINRIVRQTFSEKSAWNQYYFAHYFKMKNVNVEFTKDFSESGMKLEKDTMYHKIESSGKDLILITLK